MAQPIVELWVAGNKSETRPQQVRKQVPSNSWPRRLFGDLLWLGVQHQNRGPSIDINGDFSLDGSNFYEWQLGGV